MRGKRWFVDFCGELWVGFEGRFSVRRVQPADGQQQKGVAAQRAQPEQQCVGSKLGNQAEANLGLVEVDLLPTVGDCQAKTNILCPWAGD